MWRRLALLTVLGISLLRADVCAGLPAEAPKALVYWPDAAGDKPAPFSFRVPVKPGGQAFLITVRSVPFSQWETNGGPMGEIEIARCQDGKQVQLLPITTAYYQAINFGRSFHVEDVNFDGYRDFSVLAEYAASSGDRRFYWVYDPGSQRFVQNELTHDMGEWWGFVKFDPPKHEITHQYFGAMMGCPNTGEGREERYRVNDNRLLLVHKQDFDNEFDKLCSVTESDLIDGAMRVTKVRRYDPKGHRLP
jgi:hypothetical protein